jgi:hypothetical protein
MEGTIMFISHQQHGDPRTCCGASCYSGESAEAYPPAYETLEDYPLRIHS